MKREHIVPLSKQAITVLMEQRKEIENLNTQWVFPSQVRHRNPMSDGTVNKAIKRLGYVEDMVAHGFRALARTTIREKLKYDSGIDDLRLIEFSHISISSPFFIKSTYGIAVS